MDDDNRGMARRRQYRALDAGHIEHSLREQNCRRRASQAALNEPCDVDRHVGARIACLREAKGISRAELAQVMAIPESRLTRYETGRLRIGPGHLAAAASALEVAVDALFPSRETGRGRRRAMEAQLAGIVPLDDPEAVAAIRSFAALESADRKLVGEMIKRLLDLELSCLPMAHSASRDGLQLMRQDQAAD